LAGDIINSHLAVGNRKSTIAMVVECRDAYNRRSMLGLRHV